MSNKLEQLTFVRPNKDFDYFVEQSYVSNGAYGQFSQNNKQVYEINWLTEQVRKAEYSYLKFRKQKLAYLHGDNIIDFLRSKDYEVDALGSFDQGFIKIHKITYSPATVTCRFCNKFTVSQSDFMRKANHYKSHFFEDPAYTMYDIKKAFGEEQ